MIQHIGKQVFVYFNLHKKCWSIRHNGIVIAHTDFVCLKNVQFKVSQAGRARVLQTKQKNVHAGVFGTIIAKQDIQLLNFWSPVTYNPYKYETFVLRHDDTPVYHSETVSMGVQRLLAKSVPLVLINGV